MYGPVPIGLRANGSSRVRYSGFAGPCLGMILKVNFASAFRIGRFSVNTTVASPVFWTFSMNS